MTARRPLTGFIILLLGAWAAIVPYIGPAFSYRMTSVGSWTWTAGAAELHLAPGALAALGGLLLIGNRKASTAIGGLLAVVGGAWIALGPVFSSLWLPVGAQENQLVTNTLDQASRPLGYHYGTGVLIVLLAAYVLGRASARRVVASTDPAPAVATVEPTTAGPTPATMIDLPDTPIPTNDAADSIPVYTESESIASTSHRG